MATVSVPQQDGEIRISEAGDSAVVFPVKGGSVNVPDDKVSWFVARVDGAVPVASPKAKASDSAV